METLWVFRKKVILLSPTCFCSLRLHPLTGEEAKAGDTLCSLISNGLTQQASRKKKTRSQLACDAVYMERFNCVAGKRGSDLAYSLGPQQGNCKGFRKASRGLRIFLEGLDPTAVMAIKQNKEIWLSTVFHLTQVILSAKSRFLWKMPFL